MENTRIVYLQRILVTLISYFRDHFIDGCVQAYQRGNNQTSETKHSLSENEYENKNKCKEVVIADIEKMKISVALNVDIDSHIRLAVVGRQIELHLPVNSCGSDGLVLLIPQLTLYMSRSVSEKDYCKGPFLSKSIWISDFHHIQKLLVPIKNTANAINNINSNNQGKQSRFTSSSLSDLIIPSIISDRISSVKKTHDEKTSTKTKSETDTFTYLWNLTQYTDGLKAPMNMSEMKIGRYSVVLENFTLATWCNRNCVGTNMTGQIHVSVYPAMALTRDLYEFTSEKDNNNNEEEDDDDDDLDYLFGKEPLILPMHEIRNTVTFGLRIQPVDWIVTQGQYQAISNVLIQSFLEFQESVVDKYIPPKPMKIDLKDAIYGREAPDELLPLVTSVPVHLGRARLLAMENEKEYYELISRIQKNHHKYRYPYDSIPSWSCHHYYRKKLFLKSQPFSNAMVKSPATFHSYLSCRNLQKPLFCIHFDDLNVHFYRKHCGGGNGLNVKATSFVISAPNIFSTTTDASHYDSPSKSTGNNTNSSAGSVNNGTGNSGSVGHNKGEGIKTNTADIKEEPCWKNIPDIPAAKVVYAPRSLPQFNQTSSVSCSSTAADISKVINNDVNNSSYTNSNTTIKKRHYIQYHQQGVANLRRCVINIKDSVFVIHIAPIAAAIHFFFEPVQLGSLRFLSYMSQLGIPTLDFKTNLDVEAYAKRTIFCLPKVSTETTSALCLEVDVVYQQYWRGFLMSGPGCRPCSINLKLKNMFIAPLNEIKINSSIDTLLDPCEIKLLLDLKILSDEDSLERKLTILNNFMNLSEWSETTCKKLNCPVAKSLISLEIIPSNNNVILEHMYEAQSQLQSMHLPFNLVSEDSSTTSFDMRNEQTTTSFSNTTAAADQQQISLSMMKFTPPQVLQLRFSLKDASFFLDIIHQFQHIVTTLPVQPKVITKCESQFFSFYDIHHLPLPSYYHPCVEFSKSWDSDTSDSEISVNFPTQFQIVLRNNTYNIKIIKLELSDFQFNYSQSQSRQFMNVAAGGQCCLWAYNDFSTFWEPLIEKTTITLIAASDCSQVNMNSNIDLAASESSENMFDSNMNGIETNNNNNNKLQNLIRYDIFGTPLDINIPQHALVNLIRKIALPDVIATSSIYLPPYRIINQLGVTVTCQICCGDEKDTAAMIQIEIPFDGSVPIDRNRLMEAKKRATRRNMASHSEHRLDIDFIIESELYCSKESIPIGRYRSNCSYICYFHVCH